LTSNARYLVTSDRRADFRSLFVVFVHKEDVDVAWDVGVHRQHDTGEFFPYRGSNSLSSNIARPYPKMIPPTICERAFNKFTVARRWPSPLICS